MLNYKIEDKNKIEKSNRYKYYEFTEDKIKKIIEKDIKEVNNEEWRLLIQMLYPNKLICSGLFQAILIFETNKNGKRIDPPEEAYDSVNEKNIDNQETLLERIIKHINENSTFIFHESWCNYAKK